MSENPTVKLRPTPKPTPKPTPAARPSATNPATSAPAPLSSSAPPPSSPARLTPGFRMVVRGYDRDEVDAYIARLRAEMDEHRSPSGAVRRALEQVGDEVAGILKRAHETAAEVTASAQRESEERLAASRKEAEDRVAEARATAAAMTAQAEAKLTDLDVDTDRIWAERDRIVQDARKLAEQLLGLADAAAERFPPAEEPVTEVHDGRNGFARDLHGVDDLGELEAFEDEHEDEGEATAEADAAD